MSTMRGHMNYVMFVPAKYWQRHGLSSVFPTQT